MTAIRLGPPPKQGLYDPQFEHDACGVGFVVDIKGRKSNTIVKQGIQILMNLDHRGACGCEVNTGDGAGILHPDAARVPQEGGQEGRAHQPARARAVRRRQHLPAAQRDAAPQDRGSVRARGAGRGPGVLGARTCRRTTPSLGETAKATEPFMRQVFIGRGPDTLDEAEFERKLYVIRKRAYNEIRVSTIGGAEFWYVVSLSHKTLVYKGMLTPSRSTSISRPAEPADGDRRSRWCTRASPRTPSRAGTARIRTATSRTTARSTRCAATSTGCTRARRCSSRRLFGDDIKKILPIVNPNGCDSAMFDNVLELLVLSGRSLPHAVMMMIPEPWAKHESMIRREARSTNTTVA